MGRMKELLLHDEEQEMLKKQNETIDEIFEGIDLTVETVEVELVTGETVTLRKSEYEELEAMGQLY